jgi:hypothetical protein
MKGYQLQGLFKKVVGKLEMIQNRASNALTPKKKGFSRDGT